ncbi:MAG: GIY-YIG nuclease family protein [Nitrospira sp.]|nr:GIY-YIG nuclease family protein [Nitrospira sp.]
MYYVYILLNKARTRTYTGVTNNLERRLKEHNNGTVPSSRSYRPYTILYTKACATLSDARQEERHYKSSTGRRKIKTLILQQSNAGP